MLHFSRFSTLLITFTVFSLKNAGYAEQPDTIAQPETAQELYNILVDTTIIASASFGNNSNEYHAPDGRILGYNWDTEQNKNSCWRVVDKKTVCYYYAHHGGDTCWHFTFKKDNTIEGYVTTSPDSILKGVIKKGNPENLSDFGVKWVCKEQIVASFSKGYAKPQQ